MATMSVSLPDPMHDWIQRRIDDGHYASVSDYVRELVRKDQKALEQLSTAAIRASIAEARASGELRDANVVFDALEAKLKALAD